MVMNMFEIIDYRYGYVLWGYGRLFWGFFGSWIVWIFVTDQIKCINYSRVEIFLAMVVSNFIQVSSGEKEFNKGRNFSLVETSGLYGALFCRLLVFNIGGLWPGFYRSTEDFIVAASYALTVWLGGNLLWVTPYWWNRCSRWVDRWRLRLVLCAFVRGSELIRTLMRPISLVIRLTINIAVGEIIRSLLTTYIEKLILFGGKSELNILFVFVIVSLCAFLQCGIKVWEFFVSSFQASLFVYLCSCYSGEGRPQCHWIQWWNYLNVHY